jgi:hypothetical protein
MDLFGSRYLDGIVEEVQETISETGHVALSEISGRFNLGLDLVKEVISSAVGGVLNGKLIGGVLYTKAFIDRHAVSVRGALSALLRPTELDSVVQAGGFDAALFHGSVDELVASGRVPGVVKGGLFTPDAYIAQQREAVLGFYRQNGYIEYTTLVRNGFSNAKDFLIDQFPDGRPLPTVFVGQGLVDNLEGAMEEALASESWMDVPNSLPAPFEGRDVAEMIDVCNAGRDVPCQVVEARFVVSNAFLARAAGAVEEEVARVVVEEFKREAEEKEKADAGGKKAAAKKAPPKPNRVVTAIEQLGLVKDEGRGDPAAFIPVLARLLATGANAAAEAARAKCEAAVRAAAAQAAAQLKQQQQQQQQQEHDHDQSKGGQASSSNTNTNTHHSSGPFLPASKAELKQLQKVHLERLGAMYDNVTLMVRGAESLPELRDQLDKHVLKTVGAEALVAVIEGAVLGHVDLTTLKLGTPAERKAYIKTLAPDVTKALMPALEAQEAGAGEKFLQVLEDAADHVGLQLKRMDKKKEKALLQSHRQGLGQELASCKSGRDMARAFPLAVVMLHLRLRKVLLSAPKKLVTPLAKALDKDLGPEDLAYLKDVQQAVLAALQEDEASSSSNQASSFTDEQVQKLVTFAATAGKE